MSELVFEPLVELARRVRTREISSVELVEAHLSRIEKLSQRYLGTPYPWYGGRDQTRLLLTIQANSIHAMG